METIDIIKVGIMPVVVTVFATAAAYLKVSHVFRRQRQEEDRQRRIERLEAQLSELYGPLHMRAVSSERVFIMAWGKEDLWPRIFRDSVIPIQAEMERILLSKSHLSDGACVPESFFELLKHIRLVRCYKDTGLDSTYFDKGELYPKTFNDEIRDAYARKKEEYLQLIGGSGETPPDQPLLPRE